MQLQRCSLSVRLTELQNPVAVVTFNFLIPDCSFSKLHPFTICSTIVQNCHLSPHYGKHVRSYGPYPQDSQTPGEYYWKTWTGELGVVPV